MTRLKLEKRTIYLRKKNQAWQLLQQKDPLANSIHFNNRKK